MFITHHKKSKFLIQLAIKDYKLNNSLIQFQFIINFTNNNILVKYTTLEITKVKSLSERLKEIDSNLTNILN